MSTSCRLCSPTTSFGSIEPVAEIAHHLKNSEDGRVHFHSDATQALGKIHIDVKELGVDYLTISAHKIGGPVGIGALYVNKDAPYRPFILGTYQEKTNVALAPQILY